MGTGWQLDAAAPPRYSRETIHVALAVAEQVTAVELRIGVTPEIRGHVVDESGAPAPSVELLAVGHRNRATATADAVGGFVIQGLSPGNYILSAASNRYLRASSGTSVWLSDKAVDGVVVVVKRGLMVKGHVEPRQSCDVQHEFEVMARQSHGRVPDVSTASDGEFTLGPFDGESAKLVARCPSGDQGELRVQVAPGMLDVVVLVKPGSSLSGRVVDRDGRELDA
jgi:hypothetical protein